MSESPKWKVLITDDDRSLRNLLVYSLALHARNCEFVTCKNGAEAVDRVLDNGFDLVLMDIRMPKLDGIKATRRIRQISDVPIVVVSAYGDSVTRKMAADAGASLFLDKPVDYQALAVQIYALIRKREVRRSRSNRLKQLIQNLNYLEEQAAKYGPLATPLSLHNQIDDIKRQIEALNSGAE